MVNNYNPNAGANPTPGAPKAQPPVPHGKEGIKAGDDKSDDKEFEYTTPHTGDDEKADLALENAGENKRNDQNPDRARNPHRNADRDREQTKGPQPTSPSDKTSKH